MISLISPALIIAPPRRGAAPASKPSGLRPLGLPGRPSSRASRRAPPCLPQYCAGKARARTRPIHGRVALSSEPAGRPGCRPRSGCRSRRRSRRAGSRPPPRRAPPFCRRGRRRAATPAPCARRRSAAPSCGRGRALGSGPRPRARGTRRRSPAESRRGRARPRGRGSLARACRRRAAARSRRRCRAWRRPRRRAARRSARAPRRRARAPPPAPAPRRPARPGRARGRDRAAPWRTSARRRATSPADPRDGVLHDAAMLLVAQALAHELLGDGDGDLAHLAPQLLARAAVVRLCLRPRGLDELLCLATRGVHQLALLVRRLLQGRRADRLRLGVRGAQTLGVVLLLPGGRGARGLRRLERGLDGRRALFHLGEQRLVEDPVEDGEQDQEVEHLDDQRLVEADQPSAAVLAALGGRERQRRQEHHARGHDGAEPHGTTLEHWADSPGLVMPLKVCENYHPAPGLVNQRRITPPPTTRSSRYHTTDWPGVIARWGSSKTTSASPAPVATTVAGAARWLWRMRAWTRSGSRGGSQAMKLTRVAMSRSRSRSAAGPTVRRLAAAS